MTARDEQVQALIAQQAGEWFVAHRAGVLGVGERQAFDEWLLASPVHIQEYLGVARIAGVLPAAADDPEHPLEAILERVRAEDAGSVPTIGPASLRRFATRGPARLVRRWQFAAVAATLAVVGSTFLWWTADHVTAVHYATRHGEQATRRLTDNSVIRLDTDTAVTVRYDGSQRLVEVERGQVLFQVVHQPQRPFRVLAGFAEALAVGTKFNVYRQRDSTVVTVVEGQIAVRLAPGQPGAAAAPDGTVAVHAGEQIQVAQADLPATATPADTHHNTAWLRREIVFEQEPLGTVAEEFNRYNATPIEITTPELRALLISGVFSADDTESFVAFLRSLDGVSVEVTRTRIRVSRM